MSDLVRLPPRLAPYRLPLQPSPRRRRRGEMARETACAAVVSASPTSPPSICCRRPRPRRVRGGARSPQSESRVVIGAAVAGAATSAPAVPAYDGYADRCRGRSLRRWRVMVRLGGGLS